jgi:hypothetical protein
MVRNRIIDPTEMRAPSARPDSDFRCRVCGGECLIAPADGSPGICPDHCEDHDYVYEPGEGKRCVHCFAQPPADWYDDD